MLRTGLIISAILLSLMSPSSRADPIQLPVTEGDFWPISFVSETSGKLDGTMVRITHELFGRAGIDHTIIGVPKERLRRDFVRGVFPAVCCINPDWRTRADEMSVQLFSEPLYDGVDLFVFPHGKRFDLSDWSVLRDKRIAVVRGYGYIADAHFGTQMKLPTQHHVLSFIAKGRADVGIVDELIMDAIAPAWVEAGPVHHAASLHVRVHRSHAHILEALHPHIREMKRLNRPRQIQLEFFRQHHAAPQQSGKK